MKTSLFKMPILYALLPLLMAACDDDNTPTPNNSGTGRIFNIAADVEIDTDQGIYIAPTTTLKDGKMTFVNNGMELYSVRSARVMAGNNFVYNLDYGGGKLYQFENHMDAKHYIPKKQLDVSLALDGETYVRPTMVADNTILIHTVTTTTDEVSNKVTATMRVIAVQIPEMTIRTIMDPFVIPDTDWDTNEKRYINRVDCPVIAAGKVYYGVSRSSTYKDPVPPNTGVHTIVLDYPSLENPKYIRSSIANGATNGYRGTSSLFIDGYIYQVNQATDGAATTIVRLKDGKYDDTYSFDISAASGVLNSYANSWYYAENGIAYMPIRDNNLYNQGDNNPNGKGNEYTVLRIDLNSKTATKLNVPWSNLFKYQSGIADDGKFYMAICPNPSIGGEVQKAHVYAFDINSSSPDAFSTGIELDEGSIFVQGIY